MDRLERPAGHEEEKDLAKERFEAALNQACEKYPEASEKIKTSLETPQLGKYHNEGPKMKSHLLLMFKALEAIRDGQFHGEISDDRNSQEAMRRVVLADKGGGTSINADVVDYVFLHDIAKQGCLSLKIDGDKKRREITWEQWQEIESSGAPYKFMGKPIGAISYFHTSEGAYGQHGNKAADFLKDKGVPAEILPVIAKHEIAYQFEKISAAAFEKHFVAAGLTEAQQEFLLTASYVDAMGSLQPDGSPDLANFRNLAQSRNNYLLIKEYLDRGSIFADNSLGELKNQNKALTREDIEKNIQERGV